MLIKITDNKNIRYTVSCPDSFIHSEVKMSVHVRPKGFRFAIDRGGTFTDVYAECPNGQVRIIKLLSEDPGKYADAPREAIRRILEEVSSILPLPLPLFPSLWPPSRSPLPPPK